MVVRASRDEGHMPLAEESSPAPAVSPDLRAPRRTGASRGSRTRTLEATLADARGIRGGDGDAMGQASMTVLRRVWVIEMLWAERWAPASSALTYREGCATLRDLRHEHRRWRARTKDFRLRPYIPEKP